MLLDTKTVCSILYIVFGMKMNCKIQYTFFMKAKILSFFITLLVMSLFFLQVVSAQEITITTTPGLTPTPTVVMYQLPYPGILPGNFFYSLKSLRDKLW